MKLIKIVILFLFVPLLICFAQQGYDNPIHISTFGDFLDHLVGIVWIISWYLAPLMIIIGAFVMVTSGGSLERAEFGKKIIIWAVIGFSVALMSKGIIALTKHIITVR